MPLYFIPIILILAFGGYMVMRSTQRKWKSEILTEGEQVIYEEERVEFQSSRSLQIQRISLNLFLRVTNKRIFLLFPNHKTIFLTIDFSSGTENNVNNNIHNATLIVQKESMKMEENVLRMSGKNFMGVTLEYGIVVKDGIKIKKALGINN